MIHSLVRLAKLFDSSNETDQAAEAYAQYLRETEEQGTGDRDDQSGAIRYLAKYYLNQVCSSHS